MNLPKTVQIPPHCHRLMKPHSLTPMRTAAYARYSSEMQSEASLEDQLRNCRNYCLRMGWPEPEIFTDAAISGARFDRPAYKRFLARAGEFDVLLVDDLSRFGRDKDEVGKTVKRLVFSGVRVIGVSDGVDTARKNHKADVGLRGLMNELYLDDLAEKTHRGLTGRALKGHSAGGLSYGYRVSEVGQRIIHEEEASIVRRIFAAYNAGKSAREITAVLNAESIPSPRGGTWAYTAIHGDLRRGIGMLVNPIYVGRQVWNRSKFVKHPDTGRRVRQERPENEWIIAEHPELAIIDVATWEAAQRRLRSRKQRGMKGGRAPKHLLSGILRCGVCGGPMVIVDYYRYGCANRKDRGIAACSSNTRIPRKQAEAALLAGIKRELLSEEAFQRFQRIATLELKNSAPSIDAARKRLAEAEAEHKNIMSAIRAGIITPSTKAELVVTEAAVRRAQAELDAMKNFQPSQFIPRAREAWRRVAETLEDRARDIPTAREAIQSLLGGEIMVHEKAGNLFAEIAGSSCQIDVVAGAGYVPYLTGAFSVQLPRSSTKAYPRP